MTFFKKTFAIHTVFVAMIIVSPGLTQTTQNVGTGNGPPMASTTGGAGNIKELIRVGEALAANGQTDLAQVALQEASDAAYETGDVKGLNEAGRALASNGQAELVHENTTCSIMRIGFPAPMACLSRFPLNPGKTDTCYIVHVESWVWACLTEMPGLNQFVVT